MFSVNKAAVKIVKEQILPEAEKMGCKVVHLKNGATVVDMGVEAQGGFQAGKLFCDAMIGGMGYHSFGNYKLGELEFTSIDCQIDRPQEATLSSQFSGWPIPLKDPVSGLDAIGSGPARALACRDKWTKFWKYQDINMETVFGAQTCVLPDEAIAEHVASECGIPVDGVYILAARTGSLAGSIQVCARTVEAAMGRIMSFHETFPTESVLSGSGICPIAPPVKDELKAMDRTNTALLYGVKVHFIVDTEDSLIETLIPKLPFNASRRYGERFIDLFEEGDRDFYKVDKDIHTVAHYKITNYRSGRTFEAGELREDFLKESLLS